jgi:hypothetical protein
VTIIADDLHPTFVRTFQRSLNFEDYKEPPLDWAQAVRFTTRVHSLQQLGDYWRLLWELAASCPIPYLTEHALPQRVAAEDHERLLRYDFKVVVDNIELRKPIWLRGNPGGYSVHPISSEERTVYGRRLRFHGYVVVQEGRQLKPDELRGVLIRIKDVAIGYYDESMLDYRFNEGPRSRWLTSEIFVEEGLEDALNIDRDSFNRFHPHFRELQEFIHSKLHEEVFPGVYKEIKVRSQERAEARSRARLTGLRTAVSETLGKRAIVKESRLEAAKVRRSRDTVEIDLPNEALLETKRTNRPLAAAILGIFETAIREPDKVKQRNLFRRLLLELLARW